MSNDLVLARRFTKESAYEVFDNLDVSETTRADYRARLIPFISYIETHQFTLNAFLEYKRALRSRDELTVSTKNKYLTAARIFLRELSKRGIIPADITANVRNFRQDKHHKVDGLTDEEVSVLCEWMRQHPDKQRERAILCLLLFQGLRQAEICGIRLRDVNLKAGTLSILGKGRDDKERVYLDPKTVRTLRHYIRNHRLTEDEYLFTSLRRPSGNGRLTVRGLQSIAKGIFDELEIDKTVHGCRHYYTTKLIREMPGKLTVVAQFTRHKSLEMLEIYNDSQLLLEDLKHYRRAFSDLKI